MKYEARTCVNVHIEATVPYGTIGSNCPGIWVEMKMAKKVMDRRAARTRAMLQKAHVALIMEKGYEALTIQDICDAANVGRSTFYAHYTSKDDLRRSSFEHLRKLLVDRQKDALAARDSHDRSFAFSLTLFEHALEHIHLYRALAKSRGGAIALRTIRQILCDLVRNELNTTTSADSIPHDLTVQYVVGAYMAVLTWWLDGGAKLPPQRIDAMFRQMTTQGILSLHSGNPSLPSHASGR
jgi:AcrR family transcriptional regulator